MVSSDIGNAQGDCQVCYCLLGCYSEKKGSYGTYWYCCGVYQQRMEGEQWKGQSVQQMTSTP